MAVGQPSIYGPTKLWGPVTLGSMACIYGPVGINRLLITGLTITNILSSATTYGVTFMVGPSGSTGAATGAFAYNISVPPDGMPVSIIPKMMPPQMIDNSQVIHALSSMASGYVSWASGIEMQ